MNWGAASPCGASFLSSLGRLLAFVLGLGRLAFAVVFSTGTALIPREYTRVSHSITLDFEVLRERLAASTVSRFRGMEKWDLLRFAALVYKGGVLAANHLLANLKNGMLGDVLTDLDRQRPLQHALPAAFIR
jgi:hypothetical protein